MAGEIDALKERIAELDTQAESIAKTGQSYTIVGSHSVTNHSPRDIEGQRVTGEERVLRMLGYRPATYPQFTQSE